LKCSGQKPISPDQATQTLAVTFAQVISLEGNASASRGTPQLVNLGRLFQQVPVGSLIDLVIILEWGIDHDSKLVIISSQQVGSQLSR
jgi:hypothetical protein